MHAQLFSHDVFGDQTSCYLVFEYPGREPHLIVALYDENLGGIIKDAFVAGLRDGMDIQSLLDADADLIVADVEPSAAGESIYRAIATGDLFIDNDWSNDFRQARALVLARARLLLARDPKEIVDEEPEEPLSDEAQEELLQEFLASPFAPGLDETVAIVDHCLVSRCSFGDGDPLRWSPTVVELFMLDYLPRKVTLSPTEVEAVPEVLSAWVRFALTRRGLEERFIVETEEAIIDFADEFRDAMDDESSFGPGKSIM